MTNYDPKISEGKRATEPSALLTDAERRARILVVDDDAANLHVVTQILRRAGFSTVHGLAESTEVLPTIEEFQPDVILLDLHMPGVNGIELIAAINSLLGPQNYLPVLVLTGDSSTQARDAALAAGAKDFVTKPYERTEIILRVRNLVETRLLHVELQRQNVLLSERFAQRTEELEAAKLEILDRLARASDFHDEATHAHTARVGDLSAEIGKRLGLPNTDVEQLRIAARLHDIGKIGLSESILQKPGALAPAEFVVQGRHTLIGATILSGSRFPVLQLAEEIALTHHEAWDGSGYPSGLAGTDIPLSGRIVSVADVFDALTHVRPYKQAWTQEAAMEEITRQSGKKFDPAVIDAFVDVLKARAAAGDGKSAHRKSEAELDLIADEPYLKGPRLVGDILGGRVLG